MNYKYHKNWCLVSRQPPPKNVADELRRTRMHICFGVLNLKLFVAHIQTLTSYRI